MIKRHTATTVMKNLLKLEELGQFLACVIILKWVISVQWWVYLLLLIGPDIGMIGYLFNAKMGAITYNLFHHKGIALVVVLISWVSGLVVMPFAGHLFITGIILYGHASMDRIFGYGLKFGDNFHRTHLGWIGRGEAVGAEREAGQGQ